MDNNWICSKCGAAAYYDGRCGDGPVLLCDCDKGEWVDDGHGGFHYPTGAKPIPGVAKPAQEKPKTEGDITITIVIKKE